MVEVTIVVTRFTKWDLLQCIVWAGFILVGAYWMGIGF